MNCSFPTRLNRKTNLHLTFQHREELDRRREIQDHCMGDCFPLVEWDHSPLASCMIYHILLIGSWYVLCYLYINLPGTLLGLQPSQTPIQSEWCRLTWINFTMAYTASFVYMKSGGHFVAFNTNATQNEAKLGTVETLYLVFPIPYLTSWARYKIVLSFFWQLITTLFSLPPFFFLIFSFIWFSPSFLLLCDFLSPNIIWPWYFFLGTASTEPQRKIKALARFPFLTTRLRTILEGWELDRFNSLV